LFLGFIEKITIPASNEMLLPVETGAREEALTKMRDELQYRIEWCPRSGAPGDTVELQVRE
jgi:hypothetical protein